MNDYLDYLTQQVEYKLKLFKIYPVDIIWSQENNEFDVKVDTTAGTYSEDKFVLMTFKPNQTHHIKEKIKIKLQNFILMDDFFENNKCSNN